MVQLLEDQLEDARRLGDRHILREVFIHALMGLPVSLIKENVEVMRQQNASDAWQELGINTWRLTNYLFFFFLETFGGCRAPHESALEQLPQLASGYPRLSINIH